MSDKHTDAQGELPMYEVVFQSIAAATVVAGNAVAVSVKDFNTALAEKGYEIRATEGQAQTSAADSAWDRIVEHGVEKVAAAAAQVADSTAPGAPGNRVTELLDAAFGLLQHDTGEQNEEYVFMRKVLKEKFTRILKSAAPTAQQSLTAGGAVPTDIDGNEFEALMFAYREAKFVYGEYRDVVAFVNEKLIDSAKIVRRYQRAESNKLEKS